MAQDFYKQFQLGTDDKHISTIDPSGVALISIQALSKENKELNDKIAAQQQLIDNMQQQLEELKTRMK